MKRWWSEQMILTHLAISDSCNFPSLFASNTCSWGHRHYHLCHHHLCHLHHRHHHLRHHYHHLCHNNFVHYHHLCQAGSLGKTDFQKKVCIPTESVVLCKIGIWVFSRFSAMPPLPWSDKLCFGRRRRPEFWTFLRNFTLSLFNSPIGLSTIISKLKMQKIFDCPKSS